MNESGIVTTTFPAITELERHVLQNIVGSEYQDCDPADYAYMIDHNVYSFSVTNRYSKNPPYPSKECAGALGSLIKKGLAGNGGIENGDETCHITKMGIRLLGLL